MSVVDILRQAGFCPRVPKSSPHTGNTESVVPQRVPAVPIVPAEKQEQEPATSDATELLAIVDSDTEAMQHPPCRMVTSESCAYWQPDHVNPPGGMGHCACGWYWPNQRHACANYVAVARAEAL